MNPDRPWLKNYPQGVPAEIDPDEYRSIPAVFAASVSRYGANPAYRNLGKTLTYAEVDAVSAQFAAYLLGELGLKKGDRVAILARDGVEHLDSLFACAKLGAIHTALNWRLHWRETLTILEDTTPKVLIYSDDFRDAVTEIQSAISNHKSKIVHPPPLTAPAVNPATIKRWPTE